MDGLHLRSASLRISQKARLNESLARSLVELDTVDTECQCIPLDLLSEFIHAVALFTPLLEDSCVCGGEQAGRLSR